MSHSSGFLCDIDIFYTLFRTKAGFYSDDIGLWWVIGIGGAIIGSAMGSRCFELISNRTLKYIVYILMMISGLIAVW